MYTDSLTTRVLSQYTASSHPAEYWPDGSPIGDWFYDVTVPSLSDLGPIYTASSRDILDDGKLHTNELQALIDEIAENGGGVLSISNGTILTGSLFFRQGVHLHIAAGATLKGSDDISDYPIMQTRIEGESCLYFPGLINADGLDGFVLLGDGTIDGNGLRSWKSFALRRKWNPDCTNKDEQRPRLVYLSNCRNVIIAGLHLQNSHFWTTHLYRCDHVKYLGCTIFSPRTPVRAPSTDAIDLDVCSDILVKNCYLETNDDSVVLKGGKGPWADTAPENGSNERILIEDCEYGFCHGCLTCGSESIHNRNIILRRVHVSDGFNLLWLKLRPDTPQHYEYIRVEDIKAERVQNFININPWTQFFDLKGRTDLPVSSADHIEMRNCSAVCRVFFNVQQDEKQYHLSNFTFEHLTVDAENIDFPVEIVEDFTCRDLTVTQKEFDPGEHAGSDYNGNGVE